MRWPTFASDFATAIAGDPGTLLSFLATQVSGANHDFQANAVLCADNRARLAHNGTLPAPADVANGSVSRQHSSAELLFFVTIAVSSRKVPLLAGRTGLSASAPVTAAARNAATRANHMLCGAAG